MDWKDRAMENFKEKIKELEDSNKGLKEEIDRKQYSVIYFQDALKDVIAERDKAEASNEKLREIMAEAYRVLRLCGIQHPVVDEVKKALEK